MPRKKKVQTESQMKEKEYGRELSVAKSDDMIQNSRYTLTIQEQRCILYVISRIKPEDKVFQEYTFSLKDFLALCGIETQSYTRLKGTLKDLADKSWWHTSGKKSTLLRWFSTVVLDEGTDTVTVKLHEHMMPHLLRLADQARNNKSFYTQYTIKYILPMRRQFSPRLYELLKSYQKNNMEWFFRLSELREKLDCQQYGRWADLNRRVIKPAVEEINQYTDLNILAVPVKENGSTAYVRFLMREKSTEDLNALHLRINVELDGQLSMEDIQAAMAAGETPEQRFRRENAPEPHNGPSEGF